ncbi:50S ribosomal protein L16 [Candidatus Woesearchaeota archaeon]|nr:50S ribosomal protein L16 [Candidatus Woesearchaeota archaeon]
MARLKKGITWRKPKRRSTRVSKFKKKSFVKNRPNVHIVKYDMGDPSKQYEFRADLVSKDAVNLRHNCLESARQTSNRLLEKVLGKGNYHLKLRLYPHHILRENPLAAGAGADRMSTGMAHSFGKVVGSAAVVRTGQIIFSIYVNKQHLEVAKKALERASKKLSPSVVIKFTELKKKK